MSRGGRGQKGVIEIPYVNVPNDLSKIKTKLAFNLTKRQLVCFGIAAAVGIPSYLLARSAIGNTGAMFLMMGVALPAFLLAMYEKDGLPFEKVDVYKRQALDFLPLDRSGNRRFLPVMVYPERAEVHILDDEAASRALSLIHIF